MLHTFQIPLIIHRFTTMGRACEKKYFIERYIPYSDPSQKIKSVKKKLRKKKKKKKKSVNISEFNTKDCFLTL